MQSARVAAIMELNKRELILDDLCDLNMWLSPFAEEAMNTDLVDARELGTADH
jgi:hypothetical protein